MIFTALLITHLTPLRYRFVAYYEPATSTVIDFCSVTRKWAKERIEGDGEGSGGGFACASSCGLSLVTIALPACPITFLDNFWRMVDEASGSYRARISNH